MAVRTGYIFHSPYLSPLHTVYIVLYLTPTRDTSQNRVLTHGRIVTSLDIANETYNISLFIQHCQFFFPTLDITPNPATWRQLRGLKPCTPKRSVYSVSTENYSTRPKCSKPGQKTPTTRMQVTSIASTTRAGRIREFTILCLGGCGSFYGFALPLPGIFVHAMATKCLHQVPWCSTHREAAPKSRVLQPSWY